MSDEQTIPDVRITIARNLRYLKVYSGQTWTQVAHGLGVGERLVAHWRSADGSGPSHENVVRLAAHFGVKPEYLYVDNPESRDA